MTPLKLKAAAEYLGLHPNTLLEHVKTGTSQTSGLQSCQQRSIIYDASRSRVDKDPTSLHQTQGIGRELLERCREALG